MGSEGAHGSPAAPGALQEKLVALGCALGKPGQKG